MLYAEAVSRHFHIANNIINYDYNRLVVCVNQSVMLSSWTYVHSNYCILYSNFETAQIMNKSGLIRA